jgi:hypothetical protein
MNKKINYCSCCRVSLIKYKCLLCNCTGKIEIPKDINWNSDNIADFTMVGTDYMTCDQCRGRGWILIPQNIADMYPHNVIK